MLELLLFNFLFIIGIDFLAIYLFKTTRYRIEALMLSIILLVFVKFLHNKPFKYFGIQKFSKDDFKTSLLFFVLLFPIPLIGRLIDPSFDSWFISFNNITTNEALQFMFILIFFSVIKEEIFERSLFQVKLSKEYGTLISALSISLNFAVLHFFILPNALYHAIITSLSVFFGSLVLVLLFEKVQNLFLLIIVHIIYNIVVLIQTYFHFLGISIGEILIFGIWGLVFIGFLSRIKQLLKTFDYRIKKLSLIDYVFLVIFSLIFPIVIKFVVLR